MNGPHDLGGVDGLGAINPEAESEEPVFHAEWEKRALGLTLAAGMLGEWNIDISRFSRERLHPVDYLTNNYYKTWLVGLETLLLEANIVSKNEIATGKMEKPANDSLKQKRVSPDQVDKILKKGGSADLPTDSPQLFKIGDRVQVKLLTSRGHTRAPQYIRGHSGVIKDYYGSHVFPDESSKGNRIGSHLYNVAFKGSDIWGAKNTSTIHLDLWQDYLEIDSLDKD